MPYPIRPAGVADLTALTALDVAAFGVDPYPPFFFRQALDLWPGLLLVAEAPDGTPAGYVLAAVGASPGDAWVLSLAVHPEHGGRGLGAALMEAVHGALAQAGLPGVLLTVRPDNGRAVRLYERLGYRIEREDPAYYGPGAPRLIMRRPLPSPPS